MERWAPYKELSSAVQNIVLQKDDSSIHHVKALLRRHKPDFLNLLKNPAKNSEHRAKVKNSVNEGLALDGDTAPRTFSQDAIDEALILSDLFNLNELSALELLLEGEQQLPHYPNLTRGLVAVLLYWDGKKCIVTSLRTLIQCRRGQTWTLGVSDQVADLAMNLTDELLENGLTSQILKLISTIKVDKEMGVLAEQRGLGDVRHRRQVRDLITDVRNELGECLFYFAGQSNLPVKDTLLILNHLEDDLELTSEGKLTTSSLSLFHAALYCFSLPPEIPFEPDDRGLDLLLEHPLVAEKDFVQKVNKKLAKREDWKIPGVKGCMQLAWALTLRTLGQIPVPVTESAPDTFNSLEFTSALEQDEQILEMALAGKVFQFLKENVVSCPGFHAEEFYVRKIHGLITELIVNMPLKVKEMRNHGDEVARIVLLHIMQGEEVPNLREDFKQLMELITELYSQDENNLELTLDFWYPAVENLQASGQHASFSGATRLHQRLPQRLISLFKFLRQSGDLLPPLLYIPYLRMLAALATGPVSAKMAFDMLRMNGANMGPAEGNNVSWDHFFASFNRYYVNLRQEKSPYDASYVATLGATAGQGLATQVPHLHQWAITPQEVEGLRAVLQLIAKIAQYDENACLTIYKNPQWNACSGLLGLMQCPIPATLKGDVLLALNQLARLPEIAVGLLHAMEGIQMVGSSTGSPGNRAVELELEEVESREEQYHMTSSFLKLLTTLTETGSTISLTATTQSSGFEPYLRFTIENVFLKFMSRSYKRSEEKWEVANNALKLFNKLLLQYIPHPEDFHQDKKIFDSYSSSALQDPLAMSFNSTLGFSSTLPGPSSARQTHFRPPGFHLLVHIMNEGNFFKTIMQVIEDCITYLDKYSTKKELESTLVEAGLVALLLVKRTLGLQDSFLSCMRDSGSSILINTLDKLLLSINPRTGKADYVVTIAKFVIHNASHAELSLTAMEIISGLCRLSSATQKEVVAQLTQQGAGPHAARNRSKILHGFVEALESGQPETGEDAETEQEPTAVHNSKCRLTILRLLLHCIDLPAPNLAHFLLGFVLSKPINRTSLQDAGVLGSPRTCLHSVLSILSNGMQSTSHTQPSAVTLTPALAELCFQLVYRLSANMETTGPVLRYLRSSHDFVYRFLQHLPFTTGGVATENQLLLQQAWLLKTAAIELYSTSVHRQRSHMQRLVQLLFDKGSSLTTSLLGVVGGAADNTSMVAMASSMGNLTTASMLGDSFSTSNLLGNSISAAMTTTFAAQGQQGHETARILRILDIIDFAQEYPQHLALNEFVLADVEDVIQSCERKDEQGLAYCDVKTLHELLQATVNNNFQGSDDAVRKPLANQEVQNILKNAVERNQTRQSVHSKLALLNAWKHVLEVALNACPADLMPKERKQQILLDILQQLLTKVRERDSIPELTSPIASITLTLVTHLRTCFSGVTGNGHRSSNLVSDLNNSRDLSRIIHQESAGPIPASMTGSLQVIINGIVEWLLQAGVGQKVRANLYASLLHYLQMCQKPKSSGSERGQSNSLTGLRAAPQDIYTRLARDNLKLFQTYGDSLMELVCKDACVGHNVCRVLAYSCLDAIVQIDWEQAWLQFMSKQGFIHNTAYSFAQEDEALQQALTPNPEALRSLYIYEQKIAFLCSLSRTLGGARAILDAGVLTKLAECSFLEMRPQSDNAGFDSFIPSVMSRYRQLLFPALKLCSSILATLGGTSHYEASALVLEFMLSNADAIINPVLRNQQIPGDIQSLMEIKFVTGILCQVAGQDFSNENLYASIPPGVLIELQGHLSKIQRQFLSLLPHYCIGADWIHEIERANRGEEGGEDVQEVILLVHEICANLISYCVVIMGQRSHDNDSAVLLFSPQLDDSMNNDSMFRQDFPGSHQQQPNLGFLLQLLRVSAFKLTTIQESVAQQRRRLENIANLSTQELKEITSTDDESLSIPQRQAIASVKLKREVNSKEQLLSSLYFIIENSLLLLWRHLDSYILKSVPVDKSAEGILFRSRKPVEQRGSLRRLEENNSFQDESMMGSTGSYMRSALSLGVTREEISELKRVLPACLTEAFLTKLCDIEGQLKDDTRCTFIRPLVRRIQRIVRLHTDS